MNPQQINPEESQSHLGIRCVFGILFMALGFTDLLAWAELLDPEMGWLVKVTGADFLQPFAGLTLFIAGATMNWRALVDCFSGRDQERKDARRFALACAAIAGVALLFGLEKFVPSKAVFARGHRLEREARRAGLLGFWVAATGLAGFLLVRRRDVGFWEVVFPLERENEIWRLSIKAEVAFRALPRNQDAYQMLSDRAEFLQAEVGGRFDRLCQQLIKESADLSTIDSTARLQMDVGHVFKRYADFHARLATTRHRLCEELMRATSESVMELIENRLPGQNVRAAADRDLKVSISYPVLHDTEALKKRRAEWDDTLRGVVSIGAATGNQIIGEWIDRAARGDISSEEMPGAVQVIRSLCYHSESDAPVISANASIRTLGYSNTARELHDWIGAEGSIEDPKVASRVRSFFREKRLLLQDCDSPDVSAELLLALLRSEFSGLITLGTIGAVLAGRGV